MAIHWPLTPRRPDLQEFVTDGVVVDTIAVHFDEPDEPVEGAERVEAVTVAAVQTKSIMQ